MLIAGVGRATRLGYGGNRCASIFTRTGRQGHTKPLSTRAPADTARMVRVWLAVTIINTLSGTGRSRLLQWQTRSQLHCAQSSFGLDIAVSKQEFEPKN